MDVISESIDDELSVQGLFIDDIHRLRILDPSLADQTIKLKTECDQFLQSIYTEKLLAPTVCALSLFC